MNRNRRKYQIFSSIFSNAYFLSFLKFFPCPYLNCYACPLASFACPIGTIQHFAIIRSIPFLTIGILGMVGVLVGRMTCGWLCPFGFLQDLLARIPVPKLGIPDGLTYFRFLVLIFLVILIPLWVGEPWFSKLCPMGALQA
ncbi:MAG: 4Fe-4S binding protein, partial [Actinomycetota bacterium]